MSRLVPAVHGVQERKPDPAHEIGLAEHLRAETSVEARQDLYARFANGTSAFDAMMRRVLVRALARKVGHGLRVEPGVGFKHIETFEIGDSVFLGTGSFLQGRFDGRCVIGDKVWIGPQSYFDARDLVLGASVGWGPGAKVLGSKHTGLPAEVPVIETDLLIEPVRVEDWADIGVNAVLLPGVTIGKGAIVGAGAVVAEDVAPFAVVAGVPARFLKWREGAPGAKEP
jgi:acetyltransferase-like isoleucine patch superfamily enzyme